MVAGTHGKTTTTALIAWLLYALGLDPGFMVGGIARNFQANYRVGRGRYVVLEGDEYDTAFFDKRPKFVHFPAPGGGPHLHRVRPRRHLHRPGLIIRAFETYLETIAPDGRVLAWGDAPLVRQVCGRSHAPVSFYGLGADGLAGHGDHARPPAACSSPSGGRAPWGEFFLPMIGEHNVWNALAALAALAEVGAEPGPYKRP